MSKFYPFLFYFQTFRYTYARYSNCESIYHFNQDDKGEHLTLARYANDTMGDRYNI